MTLLKMLNGLIKPDRGTITMRGRIASLLEVGTGFNPILTGREPEGWEARRTRRLGKPLGRLPLAARRVR
jgi:ABC-type cobalamin/Fe3+-siderophores transport system ATPase subunit